MGNVAAGLAKEQQVAKDGNDCQANDDTNDIELTTGDFSSPASAPAKGSFSVSSLAKISSAASLITEGSSATSLLTEFSTAFASSSA